MPLGLVAAGVAVYANSFSGVFVLDDLAHIVDNPGIRKLWPVSGLVGGTEGLWRPLTMWTFAANYAVGELNPAGYHAVNLLIHLLAGLTLYALVRETLQLPRFAATVDLDPTSIAGAVALLWLVHPLQTESVTYIVQRGESLAGLCHLMVLYACLKARSAPARWGWTAAAWTACLAGMAAKESMVVAPVAVVLLDRVLLFPSLAAAWRTRAPLWIGLAVCWIPLVWMTPTASTYTPAQAGWGATYMYGLTQPGVLLHYLGLSLWPTGLTLEEAWPLVTGFWSAVPSLAVLAALAAGLYLAARPRPELLGVMAWGLLALAPTSSLIPLRDPAVEHRMYLPLAAVAILSVVAGARALQPWGALGARQRRLAGWCLVCAAAACLGWGTIRRNEVYQSRITMYADVVAKRPESLRGRQNLAVALIEAGRLEEARAQLVQLVALKPDYAEGHFNLGYVLGRLGRRREAMSEYRLALQFKPGYTPAQVNLDIFQRR